MIEIILAFIALLGSCGWFVSGRKYRQEVRKTRAEASREELDLSIQFVREFQTNVYDPLKEEVRKLRAAIQAVGTCNYRRQCPVLDQLHDDSADRIGGDPV